MDRPITMSTSTTVTPPFTPTQFDFSKVKLDAAVGVIGKRCYRKTIWLEYLLSHMYKYFPGGKCILFPVIDHL